MRSRSDEQCLRGLRLAEESAKAGVEWAKAVTELTTTIDSGNVEAIRSAMEYLEVVSAARMATQAANCHAVLESCREVLRGIWEEVEAKKNSQDKGMS